MKTLFSLLTLALLSSTASATAFIADEAVDLKPSLYDLNCASTFENETTERLKVLERQVDDERGVTKLVVALNDPRVDAKESSFEISSATQAEEFVSIEALNKQGKKLSLQFTTGESMNEDGTFPVEMSYEGTPLDYLNLVCTYNLAG